MDLLEIIVICSLNVASFFIGSRIGQKVVKGEEIKLPSVNPIEAIKEHNSRKEAERAEDRNKIILQNIDRYDGTGLGQSDVPRG